jgi:hypothetical protein
MPFSMDGLEDLQFDMSKLTPQGIEDALRGRITDEARDKILGQLKEQAATAETAQDVIDFVVFAAKILGKVVGIPGLG